MEDTQSQKNPVVPVLILIIILLLGLVYWLFSKPINLPPVSGKPSVYVSVNEKSEPLPYTPDGVPWVRCKEGQCDLELPDIDLDVLGKLGFSGFLQIKTGGSDEANQRNSKVSLPLIELAYASDGVCPIIYYRVINGLIIVYYHPYDPDCPPS